jgi:hypothetical protein
MPAASPLLELFEERPWQSALFLTYALSLTFFESSLLPRLRATGCEQIAVLADVDGYEASMLERGARSLVPLERNAPPPITRERLRCLLSLLADCRVVNEKDRLVEITKRGEKLISSLLK